MNQGAVRLARLNHLKVRHGSFVKQPMPSPPSLAAEFAEKCLCGIDVAQMKIIIHWPLMYKHRRQGAKFLR